MGRALLRHSSWGSGRRCSLLWSLPRARWAEKRFYEVVLKGPRRILSGGGRRPRMDDVGQFCWGEEVGAKNLNCEKKKVARGGHGGRMGQHQDKFVLGHFFAQHNPKTNPHPSTSCSSGRPDDITNDQHIKKKGGAFQRGEDGLSHTGQFIHRAS